MRKEPPLKDWSQEVKRQLWGVGLDLVGILIGAMIAGIGVDRLFSIKPWGLIGGFFLGCLAAGVYLYRLLRKLF